MEIDFCRGRWAPSTRAAYESHWRDWAAWCEQRGVQALPSEPQDIADFITERAEMLSHSSVSGRQQTILAVNAVYGNVINIKGTILRDAAAEVRRKHGTASTPKLALDDKAIKKIMAKSDEMSVRDRAVILFAFASLMRRSEIAALDMDDLSFTETALHITIRRSKTDKAGKGADIAIRRTGTPLCPVATLEAYHAVHGITVGPVFQNKHGRAIAPRDVADIAKKWAGKAGIDPRVVGAHSFRRGGITAMFRNGAQLSDIMGVSRHKSSSIAMGYVAKHQAEQNPALQKLGI